jgi:PhnB protein
MARGHDTVPVPPRYSRVDPWVISSNTEAEIAFLETAFDAQETPGSRMLGPDGRIGHVEVELGDAVIMLFDAQPDWPPTPAHLRVYVADTQETFDRAVAAGARQSRIRPCCLSGSVWHGYAIHRATSGGYTRGWRMLPLPS